MGKNIRLWDVTTGKTIKTFIGHIGYIECIAFSPDGTLLASGGYDNAVRLWDVTTSKNIKTFIGHIDYVQCVAFSPDGKTLASSSNDGTALLWEIDEYNVQLK